MSLIETIVSVCIGLVVSFISQLWVFNLYDIHMTLNQNLTITLYFTAISIVRGYAIRRFFNYKNNKK